MSKVNLTTNTANDIIQLLQSLGEVYADSTLYNEREKYERLLKKHKLNCRRDIPNVENYNLCFVYYFYNNEISIRTDVKVEKDCSGNFTIQDFKHIIAWY
jgi:hypothetical protein